MVVVDTNVVAYLLIEGERTADAQTLYLQDPDWRSEGFLLVEFSNLLATYVRNGRLDASAAADLLANAESSLTGIVNLPHSRALTLALELGVSAYDARFVAVARGLGTRLVTEDARLRQAAPAFTQTLAQAVRGSDAD
ncbi:MAG: type II toxin-antitoxin system VapC family toxin [Burkholderiales bacterium]|nr:type II toxin-antitoxin system VapC family toxin [Burkholderiales bacterium]